MALTAHQNFVGQSKRMEAANLAPARLRDFGHAQGTVPGESRAIRQKRASFLRAWDGEGVERGDRSFLSISGIHAGDGVQKASGVGMQRAVVQRFGLRDLADMASVEDADAIRYRAHDAHIVRDEETGELLFLLQGVQQVEDLGLDRDVEGRDGLVADQELRLRGQRAGNAHALPLPSGELAGIAKDRLPRQSDAFEQFHGALQTAASGFGDPERLQRLQQAGVYGDVGVQRGGGILKDHADVPHRVPSFPPTQAVQIPSLVKHGAAARAQGTVQQPAQGALSASRLAHQRQRFPAPQGQVDTVERPGFSASEGKNTVSGKSHPHVSELGQGNAHRPSPLPSGVSIGKKHRTRHPFSP